MTPAQELFYAVECLAIVRSYCAYKEDEETKRFIARAESYRDKCVKAYQDYLFSLGSRLPGSQASWD